MPPASAWSPSPPPSAWGADAVVYQVFPDRFATAVERLLPDWNVLAEWDHGSVCRTLRCPAALRQRSRRCRRTPVPPVVAGRRRPLPHAVLPVEVQPLLRRFQLRTGRPGAWRRRAPRLPAHGAASGGSFVRETVREFGAVARHPAQLQPGRVP